MASMLSSFLIGVGYEMDPASEKKINASFDRVRKGAGMLGAAAVGAGAALTKFANTDIGWHQFARLHDLGVGAAEAWGRVFSMGGSDANEFKDLLRTIKDVQLGVQTGDQGILDDLWKGGMSPQDILNMTPQQAMLNIADAMRRSSDPGHLQKLFGLSEAGVDVLDDGSRGLRGSHAAELKKYRLTAEQVASGEDWNASVQDFETSMARLGRALTAVMDGPLGTLIDGLTAAAQWGADTVEGKSGFARWYNRLQEKAQQMSPGGATGGSSRSGLPDQSSNVRQPVIMHLNGAAIGEIMLEGFEMGNTNQLPIEAVS